MKVAIIGYGVEGRAAYNYWNKDSNKLTICDQNPNLTLPEGVHSQLGGNYLAGLNRFDLIVRSPNVNPRNLEAATPGILNKVTTNTNEFFKVCPTKNTVGVTGTKGKGTTASLIAAILEADGKRVHLGGNIGVAPLDLLKEAIKPEDWVVLELSSFQLIDLAYSPHIAICLMVEPEHLDWHSDSEDYVRAKTQLFCHQTSDDFAIYSNDNKASRRIASTTKGWKIPYMAFPGAFVKDDQVIVDDQPVVKTNEIKLLGRHNWQNICAATTAVWKITQNMTAIRQVITTFSGLPNRLELVREVNGVRYYNDSFASSLHATEAAIEAIPGPKVVIIGGYDRMLPIEHFGQFLLRHQEDIRSLLIIGQSGERLAKSLDQAGFTNYKLAKSEKTMPEVVTKATGLAKNGDAVVLSPGFASYDMFTDFEDRGNQFRDAVNKL